MTKQTPTPHSSRLELALGHTTSVNTKLVLRMLSTSLFKTGDMLRVLPTRCMVQCTATQGTFCAAEEVLADVRLIWHNCRTFNTLGSGIVQLADALQKDFEARCAAAACAAATFLRTH